MKDTIYRQDAIDAMCQGWCGLDNDKCKYPFDPKQYDGFFCEGCFAVEELKKLPSAQPDIITCKDCKYSDENWRRVSVRWLPCMDMRTGSNWFCGSAERRTDDEG